MRTLGIAQRPINNFLKFQTYVGTTTCKLQILFHFHHCLKRNILIKISIKIVVSLKSLMTRSLMNT